MMTVLLTGLPVCATFKQVLSTEIEKKDRMEGSTCVELLVTWGSSACTTDLL